MIHALKMDADYGPSLRGKSFYFEGVQKLCPLRNGVKVKWVEREILFANPKPESIAEVQELAVVRHDPDQNWPITLLL